MENFEIYFHDLTEECQNRYLKFAGVPSAADLNEEISPLAILEPPQEL
jgi:hypothetical protein